MRMSDIVCGLGAALTTFGVTTSTTGDVTISIIVSVVSALIFAVINIATKIITSILEKKGLISHEHKQMLDDTADDLADDGKINQSNKKDSEEPD